eukprot:748313-Hanusia_phi.AAC.3
MRPSFKNRLSLRGGFMLSDSDVLPLSVLEKADTSEEWYTVSNPSKENILVIRFSPNLLSLILTVGSSRKSKKSTKAKEKKDATPKTSSKQISEFSKRDWKESDKMSAWDRSNKKKENAKFAEQFKKLLENVEDDDEEENVVNPKNAVLEAKRWVKEERSKQNQGKAKEKHKKEKRQKKKMNQDTFLADHFLGSMDDCFENATFKDLEIHDAVKHYKTDTQDYYVYDMAKIAEIQAMMENNTDVEDSEPFNISEKWKTSEAYQAYRRLFPEHQKYERESESQYNDSEAEAYTQKYLADMMEKVNAYKRRMKEERLNQTMLNQESVVSIQKGAASKKGLGGIGIVFELRPIVSLQRSMRKKRTEAGEFHEEKSECLPIVAQILPDSPAERCGKIKEGDVLLSAGNKSTKGLEIHVSVRAGRGGSDVYLLACSHPPPSFPGLSTLVCALAGVGPSHSRAHWKFTASQVQEAVGGNVVKQLPSAVAQDWSYTGTGKGKSSPLALTNASWSALIKKQKQKKKHEVVRRRIGQEIASCVLCMMCSETGSQSTPEELERAAVICKACDGFTSVHPTVAHALSQCDGIDDFITINRNCTVRNGLYHDSVKIGPSGQSSHSLHLLFDASNSKGRIWLESKGKEAVLFCKDEQSVTFLVGVNVRLSFVGELYFRNSLPFHWTRCVQVEDGKLTLSRCSVLCEGGAGLFADYRAVVECFTSSFCHNGGDAVVCFNGGEVRLEDCDLSSNGKSGLYCADADSVIKATSCKIRSNEFQGACVTKGGLLRLANCWLEENKQSAISAFDMGSRFDLCNSDLVGNVHGAHVQDSASGICVRCRIVENKEFGAIACGDGSGLVLRFCQVDLLPSDLMMLLTVLTSQVEGNYIGVATEKKAMVAVMESKVENNILVDTSNLMKEGEISGIADDRMRSKREDELFELEPEIEQF